MKQIDNTVSGSSPSSSSSSVPTSDRKPLKLCAVGLCGIDFTADLEALDRLTAAHPWIELGVLFNDEREGTPRYPTLDWIENQFAKRFAMKRRRLAAHLCAGRCRQVLLPASKATTEESSHQNNNETKTTNPAARRFPTPESFLTALYEWGFRRVQLNPTKVNGFDSALLREGECWRRLVATANAFPQLEFIVQRNAETRELWEPLVDHLSEVTSANVAFLFDASAGKGVEMRSIPIPSAVDGRVAERGKFGYAGGLGPHNVERVLGEIAGEFHARGMLDDGVVTWIDMESGIREPSKGDLLSLEKIEQVAAACSRLQGANSGDEDGEGDSAKRVKVDRSGWVGGTVEFV